MLDVKHYLYRRGSGGGVNANKAQGKAHYELYKATMEECKAKLDEADAHLDLAARVRAFSHRQTDGVGSRLAALVGCCGSRGVPLPDGSSSSPEHALLRYEAFFASANRELAWATCRVHASARP